MAETTSYLAGMASYIIVMSLGWPVWENLVHEVFNLTLVIIFIDNFILNPNVKMVVVAIVPVLI